MGVYSVGKLMKEARTLAAEYRKTTGTPLGISGEIAEFDAARLLDLELNKGHEGGYDAIGHGKRKGQKVQIKGRAIFDEKKGGQRIGQLKLDKEWDSVVLVIMDASYNPVEIYEASRGTIEEALQEGNSNRAKRGAMSVAKFKAIGELVWNDTEDEVEGEIWDNQGDATK